MTDLLSTPTLTRTGPQYTARINLHTPAGGGPAEFLVSTTGTPLPEYHRATLTTSQRTAVALMDLYAYDRTDLGLLRKARTWALEHLRQRDGRRHLHLELNPAAVAQIIADEHPGGVRGFITTTIQAHTRATLTNA